MLLLYSKNYKNIKWNNILLKKLAVDCKFTILEMILPSVFMTNVNIALVFMYKYLISISDSGSQAFIPYMHAFFCDISIDHHRVSP